MWNRRRAQVIIHPANHQLYNYHLGPRFDPGAQAEVFNPLFQLPLVSFRGRGRVAGEFRVEQRPQVWFKQQNGVVGVGGFQAGQVILQPLIDPSDFEAV